MRRSSVREYTDTIRQRYRSASKGDKSRLLDEFVEVTGYHRKSAARALSVGGGKQSGGKRGRPARYVADFIAALRVVWEASDRLCEKRRVPTFGYPDLRITLTLSWKR